MRTQIMDLEKDQGLDLNMAALAARDTMALWVSNGLLVMLVRKTPWTVASSELREHLYNWAMYKSALSLTKQTGFHRGRGWIQFSSKELHNALQQEIHITGWSKAPVQAQKPKALQGHQTSDEEKDFVYY